LSYDDIATAAETFLVNVRTAGSAQNSVVLDVRCFLLGSQNIRRGTASGVPQEAEAIFGQYK